MQRLVGSASTQEVLVWDPVSLQVLRSHSPGSSALASVTGGLLLGLGDSEILHYSAENQAADRQRYEGLFSCIAAWRSVVIAGTKTGEVWMWNRGLNWLRLSGLSGVTALAVSEEVVVVGMESGVVEEYKLADLYCGTNRPRFTYKHHTQAVTGLSLSGGNIVSISLDGTIIRAAIGYVVGKKTLASPLTALATTDTAIYTGGQNGSVQRLGRSETWHWQDHPVTALLALDDRLLVAAEHITLLDTISGAPLQVFTSHGRPPTSLIWIEEPIAKQQSHLLSSELSSTSSIPLLPGPVMKPAPSASDDLPKLQAMNHWLYGVWVDAWL